MAEAPRQNAPRPTLVKRMLERADRLEDGMFERAVLPPEIKLMREAAASLQALDARNKELEGALGNLASAAWLVMQNDQAGNEPYFAPMMNAYRKATAALQPATKTGET